MNKEENKVSFGLERVSKDQKQTRVNHIFTRVANRYDLMNDLMSFGIHRLWKDRAILKANPQPGHVFIDLAAGTGDLSIRYLNHAKTLTDLRQKRQKNLAFNSKKSSHHQTSKKTTAFLVDLNVEMLLAGRQKTDAKVWNQSRDKKSSQTISMQSYNSRLYRICGNAHSLPFSDQFADCVMIAFGMRNIADMPLALAEIYRILKPGGQFLCLEFSHPPSKILKTIYTQYATHIIPKLGEKIANDRESYQYLIDSIETFPSAETFLEMIKQAGFKQTGYTFYSSGIVALHSGWR